MNILSVACALMINFIPLGAVVKHVLHNVRNPETLVSQIRTTLSRSCSSWLYLRVQHINGNSSSGGAGTGVPWLAPQGGVPYWMAMQQHPLLQQVYLVGLDFSLP